MGRRESTDRLIDKARSSPNPETADFEVKSRRILESTDGKKKLVRHIAGIVNYGGGTLLVGVENDGSLDGFPVEAEPVQDIVNVAIDHTDPSVHAFFRESFEEIDGHHILRIDVEPRERGPIKYTGDGDAEFPIRKHDSTRPMEEDELRRFYERRFTDSDSEEQFLLKRDTDYTGIDDRYRIDSSSDDLDVWGFLDCSIPNEYYVYETTTRGLGEKDAESFFAAIQHYFRPSHWSGMFTVAQRRASWFGQGLGNFYDALLEQDVRYQSLTPEQAVDNHHSEGGLFACHWREGLLVINCISERLTDKIDKIGLHLLSRGIPVDTREIDGFMEATGTSFSDARRVEDIRGGRSELAEEAIMLEPTDYWHDEEADPWIVGMIVENPFRENSRLFGEIIDDISFDSITEFDRVYCHLSDRSHHSASSPFDYEYYLKRIQWWDMDELRLPIGGKNIHLVAERTR